MLAALLQLFFFCLFTFYLCVCLNGNEVGEEGTGGPTESRKSVVALVKLSSGKTDNTFHVGVSYFVLDTNNVQERRERRVVSEAEEEGVRREKWDTTRARTSAK